MRFAGASNPGRVRQNNEDALLVDPDRGIFLVVDGIGGHAAGEKAAEIAVSRIKARLERQTGSAEQRVREAIAMANNEIHRAAQGNSEWAGMACVLTVALIEDGAAVVGHVGDSRLYQIRRGQIRKVTHDHSPVGEREDSREISEAEAMRHPRRNEVFRDVGSEEHQPDDPDFIEIQRVPFGPDSALLLCSDGLSDQVTSSDIQRTVERHAGDPEAAVQELIGAANGAGGKDNVTVVLVEGDAFTGPAAGASADGDSAASFSGHSSFFRGLAWFAAGAVLAAAAIWFTRGFWMAPPPPQGPRALAVGRNANYKTIAAAMAEAKAGDVVEVQAGEYNEQVHLAEGVTVRSRTPRAAILRSAPLNQGPAVVAQDIKSGRFSGFRILATAGMPIPTGILLVNSPVEVDDVEVDGAGVGIEIRGTANPLLKANSIHDCSAEGVLILGASEPWISHNEIRRNKGAGVAARDGAHPAMAGNVFEKNGIEVPPDLRETVQNLNVILDTPGTKKAGPPVRKKEE